MMNNSSKNLLSNLNNFPQRFSALILTILFFACSTPLQAQSVPQDNVTTSGPEAWLLKMSNAIQTLNFQASFVLLKPGKEAQPFIWRHAINDQGVEMEQLSLLNGPGKEVIRIGDVVSYFEPNVPSYSLRSSTINGPLPSSFMENPMAMNAGYEFIVVGRSRISGRAAQQIRVVSRDKSRFGFNLWLDQETGLLLKMNMVDLKGQLVEQVQITNLQVTEKPHPYFGSIKATQLPQIVDVQPSQNEPHKWELSFLPLGMKVVKQDIHRLPGTGTPVEYVMLSDGLIDVSVYLQVANGAKGDGDILLRHESDTYLSRTDGNFAVTVIGKLPPKTANAIAQSVVPVVQ